LAARKKTRKVGSGAGRKTAGKSKTTAKSARATGGTSETRVPERDRPSLRLGTLKPARGATHRRKRRGLGTASGLGGTAGRGHKGQRARSGGKVARWFEGGQMPIQRRVPKRGFKHIQRVPHQVVNVSHLARFGAGETVNRESLRAKRLIDRSDLPVKILGSGDLSLSLQVSVDAVSEAARTKIEAAGGSVTLPTPKVRRPRGVKKNAAAGEKATSGTGRRS
jgi:large subunit ribosomal protein L15